MAAQFASHPAAVRLPLPPPPQPSTSSTLPLPAPVASSHPTLPAAGAAASAAPNPLPLLTTTPAPAHAIGGASASQTPSLPHGTSGAASTSVSSLLLHHFQQEARKAGEREFDAGVGERQRQQDQLLQREGGAALARKRRKTRSAYVSRYAAKSYTKLLEQHVEREHQTAEATRSALNVQSEQHARVRVLLESVESALNVLRGGMPLVNVTGASAAPATSAPVDVPLLPPQPQPLQGRTLGQDYTQPSLPPPLMSSAPPRSYVPTSLSLPPPSMGMANHFSAVRGSGALATLGAVASSAASSALTRSGSMPSWAPPPISLGPPPNYGPPPPPPSRILGTSSIVRSPWPEVNASCASLQVVRKETSAPVSEVSGSDHSDVGTTSIRGRDRGVGGIGNTRITQRERTIARQLATTQAPAAS